ncbi:hypothetical protein [Oceanirhabdus sp. W0125-5]|uniref:hypothetical protein n=1 Tax=Oceanirhabdus sp. W0125-5 TaxID=2999116 RepID=UPI0022F2D06B|nr:hypothetical protein [Oceanirhabdus sp. W0125-5]WBW95266.1 hypothetical protein OW730_16410 [Oceanirhabdus sp. W0125-5]
MKELKEFRKQLKRNLWNIGLLIVSLLMVFLMIKHGILEVDSTLTTSDHFNFLTINSILAGFLFTGLGIMISGLSKEKVLRLESAGYLDKYYFAIYTAIFLNILSIVAAIMIIYNEKYNTIDFILYMEQISLLLSIIFFIKSMNNLRKIINKIRKSN